jgi:hypothetical protein
MNANGNATNGQVDGQAHRRKGSFGSFDAKDVLDRATHQTYAENVFLFIPNLIGAHPAIMLYVVRTDDEFRIC